MINLSNNDLTLIKNISDDYSRALALVKKLFADKTDKEGKPYIGHLVRVSNKLTNTNTKIAGLLHDVVEDIEDFTFDDLRDLNFSEEIITLVNIVTKDPVNKISYHDKITKIIETDNIEAIKLKYSDITDNYDMNRLNKLDEKTKNYLINKYKDEVIRLKNILKEKDEEL